MIFTVPDLL